MAKWILLLVIVLVLGVFAWTKLPGLRTKVQAGVDEYGGWTAEARQADPVGFIEHAEKELQANLAEFQSSQVALAQARERAQGEQERTTGLLASAETLAREFRGAFQAAEQVGAWPVQLRASSYARDELVEQVRLILLQRDNYRKVLGDFERVLTAAAEKESELVTRIHSTKAALTTLDAQKEIARIQELTGKSDELLAQVNELLGENHEALQELTSPVRTVEELLGSAAAQAEAPAEGEVDALSFLQARE